MQKTPCFVQPNVCLLARSACDPVVSSDKAARRWRLRCSSMIFDACSTELCQETILLYSSHKVIRILQLSVTSFFYLMLISSISEFCDRAIINDIMLQSMILLVCFLVDDEMSCVSSADNTASMHADRLYYSQAKICRYFKFRGAK